MLLKLKKKQKQKKKPRDPWVAGWLSSLVPAFSLGVILETWDRVPHQAPCMEPASPSACVSASLCVCVCVCVSHE